MPSAPSLSGTRIDRDDLTAWQGYLTGVPAGVDLLLTRTRDLGDSHPLAPVLAGGIGQVTPFATHLGDYITDANSQAYWVFAAYVYVLNIGVNSGLRHEEPATVGSYLLQRRPSERAQIAFLAALTLQKAACLLTLDEHERATTRIDDRLVPVGGQLQRAVEINSRPPVQTGMRIEHFEDAFLHALLHGASCVTLRMPLV